MAKIKVSPGCPLHDGLSVAFKAPCNCSDVDGVIVNGMAFSFRDTHGNDLTGLGDLFSTGAVVKMLLDTVNGHAYIQNPDTNGYLEGKFQEFGNLVEAQRLELMAYSGPAPIRSQTDITAGSTALANGQSYHVYE